MNLVSRDCVWAAAWWYLRYYILPIQMSINQYYERQFQEADLALERQKVTKRLAALERKEGANNADANA